VSAGVACDSCTFCTDSERLFAAISAPLHRNGSDSLHCRGCQGLLQLPALRRQRELFRELLRGALDRAQQLLLLFCCVGLSGKDFHILNERYERRDYFA